MHKHLSPIILALLTLPGSLFAAPVVNAERSASADWKFPTIPRPSRSDIARDAKIAIAGAGQEMSSLSLAGLHNGVLPWVGKNKRDFFSFSNFDLNDGKLLMDLGKVRPVAAVAAYSWQDPHGSNVNGLRSQQLYTLYGSAAAKPDPADAAAWTKIAEVDTRSLGRGGRQGSFIRDDQGALLGSFRWLRWDMKHLQPGTTTPNLTNTWYTELDVHTPETLKAAGDAIMAGTELEETVVVFKTHFDIGFTHRPQEIVSIYRTGFIDRALDIIDKSQQLPPDQRFAWTIPAWVMEQMLWPGQDPVRRERIVKAVKQGSLVVHALPVTLETEGLDLEDLVAGLGIHTKVARELGIPLSRAGKMTDVPSHSWVLPTVLKNAGIDFLHIGCNPCNERPDVPLLYNWEGPDGSRLLTFHNQGYGSDIFQGVSPGNIYPPKDWPYKHWISFNNGCDNTPPPSEAEVQRLFAEFRRNLPQVKVKLGKMEDFADGIRAEEQAGTKVPVLRADLPDCWIHGDGTMPVKDALAHQARADLIAAGLLDTSLRTWGLPRNDISGKLYTAYEGLVMFGEHTWGGARNLQGRNAYADQDFAKTIATDGTCQYLQQTWNDKAAYVEKAGAIAAKLTEQEMAQLAANVNIEGDRLVVFNPLPYARDAIVEVPGHTGQCYLAKDLPPSGYRAYPLEQVLTHGVPVTACRKDTAVLENPFLKVTLDRAKGGIVSIIDKKTGRELVDPQAKYAFGQYLYQRFDRQQGDDYDARCEHLDSVYGLCTGWNVRADLPGNVPYAEAVPAYAEMIVDKNLVTQTQTARLTAPAAGLIASKVTTTITLPENAPWLEIAIRLDEKKPDYWPETGGFYFPVKAAKPQFRIGRLGGIADPAKDFARGSNRTYGYVNTGAMVADADGQGVGICPLDHGMMSFGEKGLYTIDPDYVPKTPVAKVSMYNNLWTINFPYWIHGTVQSRVRIWPTHDLKPASLNVPAYEACQPVLAAVATGPAGKLPAEQSGLAISRPGVRLTAFRQDTEGTLLRVWEQTGESGKITITLGTPSASSGSVFTAAQPVNLRGEKLGKPIALKKGKFSFELKANAPASFVLTPALPISVVPITPGPRTTTRLAEGDLAGITQGWGTPQKDKSVGGSPLRIGGVDFKTGIGSHSPMSWELELDGQGIEFTAQVGMQDFGPQDKGKGSVEFIVLGDGRPLFRSGVVRSGDPAQPIKLDLKGINTLALQITTGGDDNSADHADWIDPQLVHTGAPLAN